MATRVDLGSVIGPQGPAPTFDVTTTGLSTKAATTSAVTTLGSVTLSPGVYIVTFFAAFAANVTGTRWILFHTNTTKVREGTVACAAANSGVTNLIGTRLIKVTSTTTYNLYGWQNSGGALNINGGYSLIKLS